MSKAQARGNGPMRMGGGIRHGEKASDFKGSMKKLIAYLGKYRGTIILVIFLAVLSTGFSIVGPDLLGNATNIIVNGLMNSMRTGVLDIDLEAVSRELMKLVVLYVTSAVLSYLQSWLMVGVSQKVTYRLRKDISEKMNRMPLGYFDTHTNGEVLSRMTNDVDLVSQTLGQSLTQMVTSVTMIVGVLIMMLRINVVLTAVALVVIPISAIFIVLVVKRSQVYFKSQQAYLGHLNGHIEEMYGGHLVIKAFNREEESIKKFNEYNETLYDSAWKSQFLSGMMMPIMGFVGNVGYVLVCILGGYLAVNNQIEIGDIQAFIQYMRSFTQPLSQMASISNTLQSTAAASERVFIFLDEREEVKEADPAEHIANPKGAVSFKHVSFGYRADKIIIHDFTSEIQAGQKVAIVGPTGAGKTTIVKLLMRFYEIQLGKIMIDHVAIDKLPRAELRDLFGMVLQDTWLYHASIMDNIRYGSEGASDEAVIEAAKAAHVDHFIRTLPEGYHTLLNEEGSNVSQGQKQLLTIARAILKNPKILILDEATSSVDTRTEVLIQKAMENLMKGRTSFVIAHRLSTIRDADVILVMKDGDIIEQGSHETLLAKGGFYAGLYNSQFEKAE